MEGRFKFTWVNTSPVNNTDAQDRVLTTINNQSTDTLYPEKDIAKRSDQVGVYNDIIFDFLDNTRILYQTFSEDNFRASRAKTLAYQIPRLESVTGISANIGEFNFFLSWTDNSTELNANADDKLYLILENTTTANLDNKFAFADVAQRSAQSVSISENLGVPGDTIKVKMGWVSTTGIYSELVEVGDFIIGNTGIIFTDEFNSSFNSWQELRTGNIFFSDIDKIFTLWDDLNYPALTSKLFAKDIFVLSSGTYRITFFASGTNEADIKFYLGNDLAGQETQQQIFFESTTFYSGPNPIQETFDFTPISNFNLLSFQLEWQTGIDDTQQFNMHSIQLERIS